MACVLARNMGTAECSTYEYIEVLLRLQKRSVVATAIIFSCIRENWVTIALEKKKRKVRKRNCTEMHPFDQESIFF